jgi:hypothetical protein
VLDLATAAKIRRQGSTAAPLINTSLQRGDVFRDHRENRLSGLSVRSRQKTAWSGSVCPRFSATPLKQGVNEISEWRTGQRRAPRQRIDNDVFAAERLR